MTTHTASRTRSRRIDPRDVIVAIDQAGGIDRVVADRPQAESDAIRAKYEAAQRALRGRRLSHRADETATLDVHGIDSPTDAKTGVSQTIEPPESNIKAAAKAKDPAKAKSSSGRRRGPRPCAEPTCGEVLKKGTWCEEHNPLPSAEGATSDVCAVDDCDDERQDRIWCKRHNTAMYDFGDPRGAKFKADCVIDGCDNKWFKTGLCKNHKQAHVDKWAAMNAEELYDSKPKTSECLAFDCKKRVEKNGYCPPHARRIRKYDHPSGPNATGPAPKPLKKLKLSAEPLQRYVDNSPNGSVRGVLADSLTDTEVARFETSIRRALRRGDLSAAQADEIAVRALRTLPEHIWGDEWWNPEGGDSYWPQAKDEDDADEFDLAQMVLGEADAA